MNRIEIGLSLRHALGESQDLSHFNRHEYDFKFGKFLRHPSIKSFTLRFFTQLVERYPYPLDKPKSQSLVSNLNTSIREAGLSEEIYIVSTLANQCLIVTPQNICSLPAYLLDSNLEKIQESNLDNYSITIELLGKVLLGLRANSILKVTSNQLQQVIVGAMIKPGMSAQEIAFQSGTEPKRILERVKILDKGLEYNSPFPHCVTLGWQPKDKEFPIVFRTNHA